MRGGWRATGEEGGGAVHQCNKFHINEAAMSMAVLASGCGSWVCRRLGVQAAGCGGWVCRRLVTAAADRLTLKT